MADKSLPSGSGEEIRQGGIYVPGKLTCTRLRHELVLSRLVSVYKLTQNRNLTRLNTYSPRELNLLVGW